MQRAEPARRLRAVGGLALRLAIAAACLALLGRKLDPGRDLSVVQSLLFVPLPVGWALNQLFCALRLRLLLRATGIELPISRALSITFMSFFFASVLPGMLAADLVKVGAVKAARRETRLIDVTLAVLLDRAAGLLTLILFAAGFSLVAPVPPVPAVGALVWSVRAVAAAACLGVLGAFAGAGRLAQLVPVKRWLKGGRGRLEVLARLLEPGMRRPLLAALGFSVLAVFPLVMSQAAVGAALAGGDVSAGFRLQAFLAPASIVVSGLSLTPSGIGVGQLTLTSLFELSGLPSWIAVAVTTAAQLAQVGTAVVLGLPTVLFLRRAAKLAPPAYGAALTTEPAP